MMRNVRELAGSTAARSQTKDQGEPDARGVLVILEDYDGIRHMLGRHFGKLGFNVFSACHLRDALGIASAMLPEVIVIDYDLADGDALLAASALRKQVPGARIMVLGGVASEELRRAVELHGVDCFVPNGYDLTVVDRFLTREPTVTSTSHKGYL